MAKFAFEVRQKFLNIARIIFVILLIFVGTIILFPFILDIGPINRRITAEVTSYFKQKTNSEIRFRKFSILYPHTIDLYDVFVEDDFHDTLIIAKKLTLDIFEPDLRNNILKANEFGLKNAVVKVRFDNHGKLNFNKILTSFSSANTDTSNATKYELDLSALGINLQKVRFEYQDPNAKINISTQIDSLGLWSSGSKLHDLLFKVRTGKIVNMTGFVQVNKKYFKTDINHLEIENLEINVPTSSYFADYTNFLIPNFIYKNKKDTIVLFEDLDIKSRTSGYFNGSIESDIWLKHAKINHIELNSGNITGYIRKDSLKFEELYLSQNQRHICLKAEGTYDSLAQFYKNPLEITWKNFSLDAILAGSDIRKITQKTNIKNTDTLHLEINGRDTIDYFLIEKLNLDLNKKDKLKLKTKWNKKIYLEDFFVKQGQFDLSLTNETLKRFEFPFQTTFLTLNGNIDGRFKDFKCKLDGQTSQLNIQVELSRIENSAFFILSTQDFKITPNINLNQSLSTGKIWNIENPKNLNWDIDFTLHDFSYNTLKLTKTTGKTTGNFNSVNTSFKTQGDGLNLNSITEISLVDYKPNYIQSAINVSNFESDKFLSIEDSIMFAGNFKLELDLQNGYKGSLIGDSLELKIFEKGGIFSDLKAEFDLNNVFSFAHLKTENIESDFRSTYSIDSIIPKTKQFLTQLYANKNNSNSEDSLSFNIKFKKTDHLIPLLSKKIKDIHIEKCSFNLNEKNQTLNFELDIPEIELQNKSIIKGTKATLYSNNGPLEYDIEIKNILFLDSLSTEKIEVFGIIRKDSLEFDFQNFTSDSLPRYDIKASYFVHENKKTILFDTTCRLNHQTWKIKNNIEEKFPTYEFSFENQKILSSFLDTANVFEFSNLTETSFITLPYPIAFNLSGISVFPSSPNFTYKTNVNFDSISYKTQSVGNLNLTASSVHKNTHVGTVHFEKLDSKFNAKWKFDSSEVLGEYYNAEINIEKLKPALFESFVQDYFKNIEGFASGHASVNSDKKLLPIINGNLELNDISFRSLQLGTPIKITHGELLFDTKKMTTKDIILEDSLQNQGAISGFVSWENPKNINYHFNSSFKDFVFFDKSKSSNANPYGKISLTTDLETKGDSKESFTQAKFNLLKGSNLFYQIAQNQINKTKSYDDAVEFVDFSDTLHTVANDTLLNSNFINLNASLSIDKTMEMTLILDPITGDYLTATGGGNLQLTSKKDNPTEVKGKILLEEGEYKMTFYELASRKLKFEKGSEITWYGNPMNPTLNIKSFYITETSPYPLLSQQVAGLPTESIYKESRKFKLNMLITGTANNPIMNFNFEYIDEKNIGKQEINQRLTEINKDKEDLNQQVFTILLFNSFSTPNKTIRSKNTINPMDNLSSLLSSQLNSISKKYIKNVDIDWKMGSKDKTDLSGQSFRESNMGVSVKKQLINDRVTLEVGGGIEYQENQVQSSSDYVHNASVDISITEDGRFKLRFYSKNDRSFLGERIIDSGASLIYTKEYENFLDLLKKKKEENQTPDDEKNVQ